MGKAIKKIVGVAAPIVGGVFGGPAGAALGSAIGGAISGGGGAVAPSGGVGGFLQQNAGNIGSIAAGLIGSRRARRDQQALQQAALPPEVQALRTNLANQANSLVPRLDDPLPNATFQADGNVDAALNDNINALRTLRDEQAGILLEQASQLGILREDVVAQILNIAQTTGASLEDAATQLLGEDGVVSTLQNLDAQVPGIVSQAQAQIDQLVAERPELAAVTALEDQLDATNQNLAQTLPLDESTNAITSGLTGVTPLGFEGTQQTFDDLFDQSQNNLFDAQTTANELVTAFEADSKAEEDRAIENLKDDLNALGLGESGVFIRAAESLREKFASKRNLQKAQIKQAAEQQQFDNVARIIQQSSDITSQGFQNKLNAGAQQLDTATAVQNLAVTGRNQATDIATRLGSLALQGQGQAAELATISPELALQGINTQAGLAGQTVDAINSGANVLQDAGQLALNTNLARGDIERGLIQDETGLLTERANLNANVTGQILDERRANEERNRLINQQNFQNAVSGRELTNNAIQLGLTGTAQGISSLAPVTKVGNENRVRATSAISEGIRGILDNRRIKTNAA